MFRRRPDYREYRPRDRFSPDRGGPPMKRMRNDWPGDDGRPRYGSKLRLGNLGNNISFTYEFHSQKKIPQSHTLPSETNQFCCTS